MIDVQTMDRLKGMRRSGMTEYVTNLADTTGRNSEVTKTASTIYCTQLPRAQWHDRMQEKVLADAIIDRIVTNAHTTVLTCDESM